MRSDLIFSELITPVRGSRVEFDFEGTPLEIGCISPPGSGEQIRVRFLSHGGNLAGNLKIKFDAQATYFIQGCMNKKEKFTMPSAIDGEYIWRITKTDGRIIVECNGEEVINFSFADSIKPACREMWSEDTATLEFLEEDNASYGYRWVRTRGEKTERKRKRGKGKGKGKGKKGGKSNDGDVKSRILLTNFFRTKNPHPSNRLFFAIKRYLIIEASFKNVRMIFTIYLFDKNQTFKLHSKYGLIL